MSKHTSAPWVLIIGAGSKDYIGNYEIMSACEPEHDANARLITVAPRMLEVIKTMLAILGDYTALNQRTNDMRDEARAILRDVEGESK